MSDEHDDESTATETTSSDETPSEGDGDADEGTRLTKEQAMGTEDVPDEKQQAIEEERQQRLDPDNRPENAEVDNSDRDFDVASGQFSDHETDDEIGPYNDPNAEDGESEA
jgi:hypothetical protein